MKVSIYGNNGQASVKVATALKKGLTAAGIELDSLDPDIVITVGGDGTLLSAFHHYNDRLDRVRFVGIHTGHLGFYTDWRDYEVQELIDSLVELIAQREHLSLSKKPGLFLLCDSKSKRILHPQTTLSENGIRSGQKLLLL